MQTGATAGLPSSACYDALMAAPRLIAVDIGNTSIKLGWFEEAPDLGPRQTLPLPRLASFHSFPTGQTPPEKIAAELPPAPCRWHISSVNREGTRVLTHWLTSHRQSDEVQLLSYHDLPIAIE